MSATKATLAVGLAMSVSFILLLVAGIVDNSWLRE